MKQHSRFVLLNAVIAILLTGVVCLPAPAADAEAGDGFRPLFDGKSLEGWDGNPKLWRVEDGAIVGQTTAETPTGYNTFLIWQGGKPGDFELKAEFRLPNKGFGNSGIQVRSWMGKKPWQVRGYQADADADNKYTGICYGEGFRGILARRGQVVEIGPDHKKKVVDEFGDHNKLGAKLIKQHDWNTYHIIAKGDRITHRINGHLMCELIDNDTVARREGLIALQLHAGPPMRVEFRNIRLKQLKQTD